MNSLLTYILRRLLLFPLTLLGITFVVFVIVRAAPGSHGTSGAEGGGLDAQARQKEAEYWKKKLHLDKPIYTQYAYWLKDLTETGLGTSEKHNRPVLDLVAERLPVTLGMNLCAFLIAYAIAIPLGMMSALQHNRFFDRAASVVTFLMYSLPPIWVGSSLLGYFANSQYAATNWFPTNNLHSLESSGMTFLPYVGDLLWHIVLPLLTLTYAGFAYMSKQMRAAMLDVLRQDYIRTAKAKGLPMTTVTLRHALTNSLLPVITVLGTVLPALIAGSVVVEKIFSVPGMGELTYQAITNRDYNVIQAVAMVAGFLNITGLLLADIAYAIADPRISYD